MGVNPKKNKPKNPWDDILTPIDDTIEYIPKTPPAEEQTVSKPLKTGLRFESIETPSSIAREAAKAVPQLNLKTQTSIKPKVTKQDFEYIETPSRIAKEAANISGFKPQIQSRPQAKIVETKQKTSEPTWGQVIGKSLLSGISELNKQIFNIPRMIYNGASALFDLITPDTVYDPNKDVIKRSLEKTVEFYEKEGERFYKEVANVEGAKKFVQVGVQALPQIVASAFLAYGTGGIGTTSGALSGASGPAQQATARLLTQGRLVSKIGPELTRMIPFGTIAASGYAREAEKEGANYLQQVLYGVTGGLAEMATEAPVFEGWLNIIDKLGATSIAEKGARNLIRKYGNIGIEFLKNTAKEAMQEAAVDPIANLAKKAIYMPDMPYAGKGGVVDIEQMIESAYGGMAMSVILGALGLPYTATAHIMTDKMIKEKKKATADDILDIAKAMHKDITGKEPEIRKIDLTKLSPEQTVKTEQVKPETEPAVKIEAPEQQIKTVAEKTIKSEGIIEQIAKPEIKTEIPSATPKPESSIAQKAILGKTAIAKTERGTSVQTQYAIVDANDLITSHDIDLRINPNYPQELQPRDRTRAASELQITRIANNIEPEFLAESPKASEGAPIVGPDMIVESGNARVIALKRAYNMDNESIRRYKQWLIDNAERFGVSKEAIAKIEKPVLVRIRQTDVDRVKFAQEANEQSVAALSTTEQAIIDAQKMRKGLLELFIPSEEGEIVTPANMEFIRAFMQEIVSPAERGRYITKDGTISQEGITRIRNAIFAKAYSDIAAITKLAESPDDNIRNITKAMLVVAPRFTILKEGIKRGEYYDLDITEDIAKAANKLSQLRESGQSVDLYLRQIGFLDDELSDIAKDILDIFDQNKRSAKKLIEIFNNYIDTVIALGSPKQVGLFENAKITKADVLETALKKVAKEDGTAGQIALFQDQSASSGVFTSETHGVSKQKEEGARTPTEAEKVTPEETEKPKTAETAPPKAEEIISISPDDIPYELARLAWQWISHTPEERVKQEQQDYVKYMQQVVAGLSPLAKTETQKQLLKTELEKFKQKYIEKYKAVLAARAKTASVMVTGPAKFDTAKNQKAVERERKLLKEFVEWRKEAIEAIKDKVINNLYTEATEENINAREEEAYNALMKEVRKTVDALKTPGYNPQAFRNSLKGKIERVAKIGSAELKAVQRVLNEIKELQEKNPDITIFTEKNSIWKLLEAQPETAQTTATTEKKTGINVVKEYEGAQIIENFDDDRVQIVFDGKPDAKVLNELKQHAWKWSPKNKAWQRKLTDNAKINAKFILDKYYKPVTEEAPAETSKKPETAQVEQYRLLKRFWEGGQVPYSLPEKPIPQSVISKILELIPTAESVDDLKEYANAFWNLQAKRIMQGRGSTIESSKDAYEYLKKTSHHPEVGMSVVKVDGKEYIVTHKPIREKTSHNTREARMPLTEQKAIKKETTTEATESIEAPSPIEITEFIAEKLQLPIRIGRYRGKALGIFKTQPEVVRTKMAYDIDTIAHEVGHYLDKKFGLSKLVSKYKKVLELSEGLKGDKKKEALAEFVRLYLTDKNEAQKISPEFYDKFEATIAKDENVFATLREAQRMYEAYKKKPSYERFEDFIDYEGKGIKKRSITLGRLYSAFFDELHALNKVVEKMLDGKPIPASLNPYARAMLHNGWVGKAQMFLFHHQFDIESFEKIGPSLQEILKPFKTDEELKDFSNYLVAKRIIELEAKGISQPISGADSEAMIEHLKQKYGSRLAEFEEAAQELYKYQDNVLKMLLKSEVISEELYNKLKETYAFYVPLYKVFTEGREERVKTRGFVDSGSPIRRIGSSGRQIIPPIESIIRNTYLFLNLAERNMVAKLLVELAETLDATGKWVERIDTPVKPVKVAMSKIGEMLQRAFEEAGISSEELNLNIEDLAVVFQPFPHPIQKENIALVFRNGKPVMYQFDPELYAALKRLDAQSTHWFIQILSYPARLLRAGAVLSPDFPPKNILRDQFSALIFSKYGYIPVADMIKGLAHVLKKDDLYHDFYASGAAHGALVSLDRDYLRSDIRKIIKERTATGRAKSLLLNPIEFLRFFGELAEEATRVAEMEEGIKAERAKVEKEIADIEAKIKELTAKARKTKDTVERQAIKTELTFYRRNLNYLRTYKEAEIRRRAALAARDVTLDFSRGGFVSKELNKVIAFFNPGVQGLDKIQRSFRENPARFLFRVGLYITLPTLICFLINKDNEYYEELPRWEKYIFWHIPIPGTGGKRFIRIPKPFELGILFGTLPQVFLEYAYKKDKKAFKELDEAIKQYVFLDLIPDKDFVPLFPVGIIPTAFIPILEIYANKSTFTKAPIVPEREKNLLPYMQYGENTSEVAKLLGRIFNTSPRKIDQMIYGYTGGLGRNVSNILDIIFQKTGIAAEKVQPAPKDVYETLRKIPAIGAFISKYPTASQSPTIQDFYDDLEKAEQLYSTAKAYYNEHKKPMKISKEDYKLIMNLKTMRKIADTLSEMRKAERETLKSTTMTPEQKRKKLDELEKAQINLIRQFYSKSKLK